MNEGIEVILYVADQARSRAFYRLALGRDPVLDVPGMTSFELGGGARLGLMPEADAAELLGPGVPSPAAAARAPRVELYLLEADLPAAVARLEAAGAEILSGPMRRSWGDVAAYALDPDRHVIAVARRGERS